MNVGKGKSMPYLPSVDDVAYHKSLQISDPEVKKSLILVKKAAEKATKRNLGYGKLTSVENDDDIIPNALK